MLLRISCELDRAERRHAARVRGDNAGRIEPAFEETESAPLSGNRGQSAPTATPASIAAELRGQRARVEPRFGAQR
jgi:hypothetical protein